MRLIWYIFTKKIICALCIGYFWLSLCEKSPQKKKKNICLKNKIKSIDDINANYQLPFEIVIKCFKDYVYYNYT